MHTVDQLGPIEKSYDLQTNDPQHAVITVTVVANVKPLPDYVKRITTANVTQGETVGAFEVWPTTRPTITLESGERLLMSIRFRPRSPDAGTLKLPPDAPSSWKLRREPGGFYLDIPLDSSPSSTVTRTVPLIVDAGNGNVDEIKITPTVYVDKDSIVVTPAKLDFGELALQSAAAAFQRVGIRKQVGTFHVKSVSSSLPFLKLQQVTIVEGSNYVIRITIDPAVVLKPGSYEGVLTIDTDQPKAVEVPLRIKLLDQ